MNNNCIRKFRGGMAARVILGSLAAFALLAGSGVYAQDKEKTRDDKEQIDFSLIANPVTPTAITPPVGNHLFLAGHALGSQGYVCLPKDGGVSWTVNAARPEATLFTTFFGGLSRSSPTFSATTTIPRRRNRWLSATQLGRARSTAAKCGQLQLPQPQLLPARTRVARIRVPLPACC